MSQNHPHDNIYNILGKLKALEPTPAETVKAKAQQIRESVDAQGSILKGLREVSDVEQRLSQMFAETKKVSESQGMSEGDDNYWEEIQDIMRKYGLSKQEALEYYYYERDDAKDWKDMERQDAEDNRDVAECAMCEEGTCTEHGVAEGQADQVKNIVKKNGKPVGEIGTDPEASPGNGNWYVKHYASGYDVVGFNNAEEALAELKHCMEQGVAEGTIHKGTYGTSYDPSDEEKKDKPKHVPRKGEAGARSKAERQAAGDVAPDLDTSRLGPNPFSQKVVKQPDVWKGPVTKISGARSDDTTNADDTGDTPEQRANKLKAKFKKTGKIGETNLSLSESLARVERKVILEANLKELTKQHHMTMDEMLECLRNDAQAYKTHGHMSSLLRDCMDMHTHNKSYMPALADEGTEKPGMMSQVGQAIKTGAKHVAHGINKVVGHPSDDELLDRLHQDSADGPDAIDQHFPRAPGQFNEELQKLAELAGLTLETNDGDLANNYPPYDKVTRGDVIAGRLGHDQEGGKKEFDEADMEEGNLYAYNVLKAKQAGKTKADLDGDGTLDTVKEDPMADSNDVVSVNELRRLAGMPVDETGGEDDWNDSLDGEREDPNGWDDDLQAITDQYCDLYYQSHEGYGNDNEDPEQFFGKIESQLQAIENDVAEKFGPEAVAKMKKAAMHEYWGNDQDLDEADAPEADAPVVEPKTQPVNNAEHNKHYSINTIDNDGEGDSGRKRMYPPSGGAAPGADNGMTEPARKMPIKDGVKESALESRLAAEYASIKKTTR